MLVYLTLFGTTPLKTVEVKTEYLDYFTRNILSFGLSSICVVSDIDKTGKRYLKLASQYILPTFVLLNSSFVWCRFSLVTVGPASLPNLVGNDTVENSRGEN